MHKLDYIWELFSIMKISIFNNHFLLPKIHMEFSFS